MQRYCSDLRLSVGRAAASHAWRAPWCPRSVDSAIASHESWKKKLLRDSAPTGDIVQVEEQLTKLKEVSQFKWVNIEAEL